MLTTPEVRPFARLVAAAALLFGLATAPPAYATLAFVKNVGTAAIGHSTGKTLALTLGAGVSVPVGEMIAVAFAVDPNSGAITCADTKGNTYVADVDVANGSGTSGVRSVVFHALVGTALAPGDKITVTHPSTKDRAM